MAYKTLGRFFLKNSFRNKGGCGFECSPGTLWESTLLVYPPVCLFVELQLGRDVLSQENYCTANYNVCKKYFFVISKKDIMRIKYTPKTFI